MCNVSLPSSESMKLWFCFKAIHVNIVGHNLVVDLLMLEIVNYDDILGHRLVV